MIPLDLLPSSKGRFGIVRRFPIGPIAGISPFNFPLNLALHKVAPALASGNPIVLKPPSRDPLTMLYVAEIIDEIGVPKGAVSVLPMDREVGDALVADERFKLLSFTGSPDVGWEHEEPRRHEEGRPRAGRQRRRDRRRGRRHRLRGRRASGRRVRLRRPGLHLRPARLRPSSEVYDAVPRRSWSRRRETIKMRRPARPRPPNSGPMIDDKAAARSPAVGRAGGRRGRTRPDRRQGRRPLLRADGDRERPPQSFVCSREAFAPLVTLFPVDSFGEAIRRGQRLGLRSAGRRLHQLSWSTR